MENESIFVSVPSYRDPECHRTITDLFEKAAHPERIVVGLFQQNHPQDVDFMVSPTCQKYRNQIRALTVSHYEAKGPMYARHIIEQYLYQGEMFFLQIDSHCLFTPNWDQNMIYDLLRCDSDKPILTTYPPDFDRLSRRIPQYPFPSYLHFRDFHPRLGFTEQERRFCTRVPSKPLKSLFWAAGFSFTLGEAIREVPYDPYCPFVFVGEEMSMSIRYFTHGWDFFAPTKNFIFHLTKRTYRPTFWEQVYKKKCVVDEKTRQERKAMEAAGVDRLQHLITGYDLGPFGVGNVRTIKDWEEYTGVDIRGQKGSQRSYWGLSPRPTPEEQICKIGKMVM